jgi:hypothetical protein
VTDLPGRADPGKPSAATPVPTVSGAPVLQEMPAADASRVASPALRTPRIGRGGRPNRTGTGPWGNYIQAILLIGLVPLFPIILEGLLKGSVLIDSLTLTATIYAVTIAIASCNIPLFLFGFCVGILSCALYAQDASVAPVSHPASAHFMGILIISEGSSPPSHDVLTLIAIFIFFLCVIIERYFRHVVDREIFLEFMKGRS